MRCSLVILAFICGAISGPVEDALQEFTDGNHRFTAAMYKELIKLNKDNIIVSPFSAEAVLALTNEGARGDTASEFIRGLSLPSSKGKTQNAFKNLLPKLKKSDDLLKLLSANKIYAGKNVKLENSFKNIATSIYDSSIENVDFTNKLQSANTINKWVADRTNQKIQNLISPDSIDKDVKLILVNALYFHGNWVSWFDNYLTSRKPFFLTKDKSVEVETMRQIEYFNYYEDPTLNAKFVELPYEGANINMVIVLPNEIDGLSKLENNIEQVLQSKPFTNERVDISLPKFSIETQTDFVPILQKLGLRKVFTDEADLSGISSTHKELYVSSVAQKAFINVTETGTEAGAATEAKLVDRIRLNSETVRVDHPFLFYIKYKDVILFIGRKVSF